MSYSEGKVDFTVPSAGKTCYTAYKIFGTLGSGRPLVLLHGGPGSTHHYILPITKLAESTNIPVILYDQLGNGASTHLPEKMGDTSFWTTQLFLDELDNLLVHLEISEDYDLLGHSWGGMLAGCHAVRQPKGLRRLILGSAPANMKDLMKVQSALRGRFPQDVQDTLKRNEDAGTTESQEYKDAVQFFYDRHVCKTKPTPLDFAKSIAEMEEDMTVYLTMNGPNEFFITGSLGTWSILDDIHRINVPTLLTNGVDDEVQDELLLPWFNGISKVKWVRFANSSHTSHLEEPEQYLQVLKAFLETGAERE